MLLIMYLQYSILVDFHILTYDLWYFILSISILYSITRHYDNELLFILQLPLLIIIDLLLEWLHSSSQSRSIQCAECGCVSDRNGRQCSCS